MKEADEIKSVVTQADIDAQKVIMKTLRNSWKDSLQIIGEEDDDDDMKSDEQINFRTDDNGLININQIDMTPYHDIEIPIDELTIFVDPLDGTREFVEGRLENVACLIGIARNGKAIGGAVGVPFPDGLLDNDPLVHYSFTDDELDSIQGTYPSVTDKENNDDVVNESTTISIFTGDSNDPVLQNATSKALSIASSIVNKQKDDDDSFYTSKHQIIGGTAAKLQAVAREKNSIAILHFKSCLWDTCATEALVNAKGGKVTDLFGSPLTHSPDYKPGSNVFGVVASSGEPHLEKLHDSLCKAMKKDTESIDIIFQKYMGTYTGEESKLPQALDIARDLDGAPLNISWLEEKLCDKNNESKKTFTLKAYAVPESGSARGLMSNGCRVMLEWEKKNDLKQDSETNAPPPSTAFYKRVVMSESPDSRFKLKNVPHKLIRDVRSYQVETAFLTSAACQHGLIEEAGVHVNKVYASDLRPAAMGAGLKEQIQSKFAMLVQDLNKDDGWNQEWLLEYESTKAALKAFADMHGYFWYGSNFWDKEGGEMGRELENAVWPNGGYMQPTLQGFDQLENVAAGWNARLPTFEKDLKSIKELENVNLGEIGTRLQNVAKIVGSLAHPFSDGTNSSTLKKYRTLIHGDPKQANIFLREKKASVINKGDTAPNLEAGLIDFQWSGFGLAATDIAHHICAAVHPTSLSYDGSKEKELLDFYYSCLSTSLVRHGVASTEKEVQDSIYPRAIFQEQYEVAVLDLCRMVFAYAWKRWKPETEPTSASLNRNAYNKYLPSVLWLITRCSQILSAREESLLGFE